ncbi:NAD(P)/FAD-dependent oxidoreductase [Haloparvum sp. PAK95]|uniref:NAD(P)/FAD-dependent oxidoreductase n=1 Tax=Haloparvum sp. PAK95 TaxID=3418962 RepID=UPI003D2EC558
MDIDVAVVGGGAVGVTTAGDLAERGANVTLFERDAVASGSSGRAAGVLYDAYADAVDAEIAGRSMERFRRLADEAGFEFTQCPYVIAVQEGDDGADAIPEMVERMRAHGEDVTQVDPVELGKRFPLETDDLATAAVATGAGYVDPAEYTAAMAKRARAAGVTVREGTPVALAGPGDSEDREPGATVPTPDAPDVLATDPPALVVDPDGDATRREFDAVVVATGAHTPSLLADAGVSLATVPYRVQALTSRGAFEGPMTYDASAGVYLRPHPTGLLAGDGTEPVPADPETYDREGDDWFVENVREAVRQRADYEVDPERAWAGLCTATPDGDPLLGEVAPGVVVATGWQGHGFMRAPGHAERLAEQAIARATGDAEQLAAATIDAFDPTRFDGDEEFEIVEGMDVENR